MEPTLHHGDLVLVSQAAYLRRPLARGDIVLIALPTRDEYVKRVVGLAGEQVRVVAGRVSVNGVPLDEPRLLEPDPRASARDGSWLVGEAECFLLGDNRSDSFDSRAFGPVPLSWLRGRVWYQAKPAAAASSPSHRL